MNNFFTSFLIVLFFVGCKDKDESSFLDKSFIGKPLVPKNIAWKRFDSLNNPEDLYSNYRTIYFIGDSTVYMFDCLNDKQIHCIDTSILDKANNVYIDTVTCKYEDSILFAVENLETYKGKYQIKGDIVVCEMQKKIESAPSITNFQGFTDTLKLVQQQNGTNYIYRNMEYRQALDFKAESYRRLLEYTGLNNNRSGISKRLKSCGDCRGFLRNLNKVE